MSKALIVIDMQKGFLNESSPLFINGAPETVDRCAKTIDFCHDSEIPIFFVTRLYNKEGTNVEHTRYKSWLEGGKPISPGCAEHLSADMPAEFKVLDKDYQIIKPRFSAFFATDLDMLLRRLKVDEVVLIGTTTPNCIRTTCYDAISLEYNVTIIENCTSSRTREIQDANILDMKNIGAKIVSFEEFVK